MALPGKRLDNVDAQRIFQKFIEKFRTDDPLRNVPTHCDFKQHGALFWGHLFDDRWIPDDQMLYYIEETGLMQRFPQEVRFASMEAIREYLRRRDPWKFADTYILPKDLSWCIVITHDDICLISNGEEDEENS